jgi:NAD dependent epimerase/dehydratase family enzyme
MHLVLTGATGLVGSAVLHNMIITPSVSKVSVLSRRPVAQAEGHEKVKVIIHKDYSTYSSEVLSQLKDVDGVVWAQGISSTQVGKECVSHFPSCKIEIVE